MGGLLRMLWGRGGGELTLIQSCPLQGCGSWSWKCAFNILNGLEAGQEGRGQNTPTTAPSCFSRRPVLQEILTDHWKSTHTAWTTRQWHSTTSPPPNPLPTWVEQIHIHTLSHTNSLSFNQTVTAIPPGSSTSSTDWTGLEGLCRANGGGVTKVKGDAERGCTHPHSGHINRATSKSQLQNWGIKKQRQLAHTCTAHGRLGTPTHQIRVNC